MQFSRPYLIKKPRHYRGFKTYDRLVPVLVVTSIIVVTTSATTERVITALRPVLFRLCYHYFNSSAFHITSVQFGNRRFSGCLIAHFNEAEAA